MRKPRKSAFEIEALIKWELAEVRNFTPGMSIRVLPDGSTWKLIVTEGSISAQRREIIELVGDRLRLKYDLLD